VTWTPLSRSKGQRSRSPGRFTYCGLNASGSCSRERGNVLGVGNYCYVAVCTAALGASGPQREERGGAYRGGHPPTACSVGVAPSSAYYRPLCIPPPRVNLNLWRRHLCEERNACLIKDQEREEDRYQNLATLRLNKNATTLAC